MKRVIFWATVISGAAAAYLMYRRGEPLGKIAKETILNPTGALLGEIKQAV
jgi:hypothetical protein